MKPRRISASVSLQRPRFEGTNKSSIIVFAVGVNDSSHMNGSHRVGLDEYVRNMEVMIDQAGEHFTKKIVCVGLAPIDESKTVPFILEKDPLLLLPGSS